MPGVKQAKEKGRMDDERMGGMPLSRGRPRKHVRDRPLKSASVHASHSARSRASVPSVPVNPQPERRAGMIDEPGSSDGSGIDMEEMLQRLNLPVWDDYEHERELASKGPQRTLRDNLAQDDEMQQLARSAEFSSLESMLSRASIHELLAVPFQKCHIFGLTSEQLAERNIMPPVLKWKQQKTQEHEAELKSFQNVESLGSGENTENAEENANPAAIDISAAAETLNDVGDSQHSHEPDDFDSFLNDMGA